MVLIEALSTPECQEGVQSPGGQREGEHGGSGLCHYVYSWLYQVDNERKNMG